MPQDGNSHYEESFNSFLAGVFLTRRSIKNLDFFNFMNSFSSIYNVDIVGVGSDISVPIYFDDDEITLVKNMDDLILVNNNNITVREYLYSFTSSRVREFFKIPDLNNKNAPSTRKFKPFVRTLFQKKISI